MMELRFSDQKGFNYLDFLEQLQPLDKLEDKYRTRMSALSDMRQQVMTLPPEQSSSTMSSSGGCIVFAGMGARLADQSPQI